MTRSLLSHRSLLLLLAIATMPATTTAQGGRRSTTDPLNNDSLRQAVEYWMGTEHNRMEITNLLGHIGDWDTSQVTSFAGLFKGYSTFDEDISMWNTERVTDMSDLFSGCTNTEGKASLFHWNTSKVTTMTRMFKAATMWEGDLSMLDTSSVTDMSNMFQGATFFKGEGLDVWDVSKVETFNYMFSRATNFNADISEWNTQSATFMEGMFQSAVSFNQDIGGWNMTSVQSVENMLEGTAQFQQSLCWSGLSNETVTSGLFCLSHPGANLDPCCVTDGALIRRACCPLLRPGGSCDTYCPVVNISAPTEPPISNDPPLIMDDDNMIPEETMDDDDDDAFVVNVDIDIEPYTTPAPTGILHTATKAPSATVAPTQVPMQVTDATPVATNAPSVSITPAIPTNPPAANDQATPVPGGFEGEDNDQSRTDIEEQEGSYWDESSWLRVTVFVVAVCFLMLIFLYILEANVRPRRRPSSKNAAAGEAVAKAEKDEEAANIETKPTEESDGAFPTTPPPGSFPTGPINRPAEFFSVKEEEDVTQRAENLSPEEAKAEEASVQSPKENPSPETENAAPPSPSPAPTLPDPKPEQAPPSPASSFKSLPSTSLDQSESSVATTPTRVKLLKIPQEVRTIS